MSPDLPALTALLASTDMLARLEKNHVRYDALYHTQLSVRLNDAMEELIEARRMLAMIDPLLNHCDKDGGECQVCSVIVCPHKEPLHFHHDGCPACETEPVTPA